MLPWDRDGDLGVLDTDLDRLVAYINDINERAERHSTQGTRVGVQAVLLPDSPSIPVRFVDTQTGMYVDLFPYSVAKGKLFYRWSSYAMANCAHCQVYPDGRRRLILPVDVVLPLTRCEVEQTQAWCPQQTER